MLKISLDSIYLKSTDNLRCYKKHLVISKWNSEIILAAEKINKLPEDLVKKNVIIVPPLNLKPIMVS